jgi:hypothetical protein
MNDTENQIKDAYAHVRTADHARRVNRANADMEAKARARLREIRARNGETPTE